MGIRSFPFVTLEYGVPARPLVPFDFPKGKNVLCLIDSGASVSLVSEAFRQHEELEFRQRFTDNKCEGVCGKNCLEIIGVTKEVAIRVEGIGKEFLLSFYVMSAENKVQMPIIGQNFFEQATISFRKEKGAMHTVIEA
ncbi:retroviral-like aspartic protease [Candidatus Micrarchaeota archaeon]|nr:retroviral-like aspartic protease [Candidatus Micrarchaeota archaeon]